MKEWLVAFKWYPPDLTEPQVSSDKIKSETFPTLKQCQEECGAGFNIFVLSITELPEGWDV
jgi:hypothetical protein